MRYVGVDPGQTGAAVVVGDDGLTVLDVQRWAGVRVPPALVVVRPGDVVAVEAQYLGQNARSMVTLVEWTGRLLAALPADVVLIRPLASMWRSKVFRNGRVGREAAKRMAAVAGQTWLEAFDADVRWRHDDCEAWCMARYARFWALNHLQEVTR